MVHLDEQAAVFEAMLTGWERQQKSRLLADATIAPRVALLRRFVEFAGSFPWQWNAGDVEDFTVSLMSGGSRLAPSTIRGYHLALLSVRVVLPLLRWLDPDHPSSGS
ncbi:hypothetical protein [Sinomonas sp. P47F7]|uniref:hypothetical protein n=1 Tax=Sinomonas sp. P47F7 TaxID=3410987 RepID=UPI003BF4B049